MIRIAVIAQVPAVRAGLRALLEQALLEQAPLAPALDVIGESAGLTGSHPLPPEADVLLVVGDAFDVESLGQGFGPGQGRSLGDIALLLLSEDRQAARQLAMLPLRAWGVLALEASAEELVAAVRALYEGLVVAAPGLLPLPEPSLFLGGEERAGERPAGTLTERESQVLQLLAQGLANKQIAAALGISEHTVKFHVSSLYAKLGATNRAEAVRLGVQSGFVLL